MGQQKSVHLMGVLCPQTATQINIVNIVLRFSVLLGVFCSVFFVLFCFVMPCFVFSEIYCFRNMVKTILVLIYLHNLIDAKDPEVLVF